MMTSRAGLPRAYFVIGKGGVGKSTVAAGLSVALAQKCGGATFVEFGDGETGERLLGSCSTGVDHKVIRLDDAVTQAAAKVFGSAMFARIALGNFAVKPLIRATPALREIAVMEVVRALVAESDGRPVVVDLPATGHGLAWLRVPRQGVGLLQRGPLYQLCVNVCRELLDAEKTALWVVSLAEQMVLKETAELCGELDSEVGLPVANLIINRAQPAVSEQALAEARALASSRSIHAAEGARLSSVLEARQQAMRDLQTIVASDLGRWSPEVTMLPIQYTDPTATEVAERLRQQGVL